MTENERAWVARYVRQCSTVELGTFYEQQRLQENWDVVEICLAEADRRGIVCGVAR